MRSLLDYSIDRGEDAPWNPRDGRIIAAWAAGLLVFAVAVAALATAIW